MRTVTEELFQNALDALYEESPVLDLEKLGKLVIFSDFHVGDRGRRDDFRGNSRLILAALERYYLKNGFGLILNGDIEELQKFRRPKIRAAWPELYRILDGFSEKTLLVKIRGNHDEVLESETLDGVRLRRGDSCIFIFHGHQASHAFTRFNPVFGFLLRYFAAPLGIKNLSVSTNQRKKFRTERRAYDFSRRRKIISIIGHTHRPLFESLSKADTLKFRVEELCRSYPRIAEEMRDHVAWEIESLKKEYTHLMEKEDQEDAPDSLYGTGFMAPCVFNSGCGVGKRGVTCIEIEGELIRLIHWFDSGVSHRYLDAGFDFPAEGLEDSSFYRVVIKEDNLDYVFTRIRLLA